MYQISTTRIKGDNSPYSAVLNVSCAVSSAYVAWGRLKYVATKVLRSTTGRSIDFNVVDNKNANIEITTSMKRGYDETQANFCERIEEMAKTLESMIENAIWESEKFIIFSDILAGYKES